MSEQGSRRTEKLTGSVGTSAPLPLKLRVIDGGDVGREFLLEVGAYRLGSGAPSELLLSDGAVSRVHLMLEVLAGSVRLTDNGSTNGSFCGPHRFQRLEVTAGALVRVGRTTLKLVPVLDAEGEMPPSPRSSFGGLSGQSRVMRRLFTLLERVAPADVGVFLHGETGTGKELAARAIHAASPRAAGPFIVGDLAAISSTLFESELFGHERGAFTGASQQRAGAFEQAHGGTLFLDEIGELPRELQPRLLRALERHQVKRVGGDAYLDVDVRVIAATHRDLEAEVREGRFREDLYHRLAVVRVSLPPLRERSEDIPLIVDEVLQRLGKEKSVLSSRTRASLLDYAWPGNVRELRNVVERVASLGVEGLPELGAGARPRPGEGLATRPFKAAKERLVQAFERDYLLDLLARFQGNISRAAQEAGIDRVYLHRLLRKHDIEAKPKDD